MKQRHTGRKRKGTFLITVGLLLLAAALILCIYNYWDGSRADKASLEVSDQLIDVIRNHQEEIQEDGARNPYDDMPGIGDEIREMKTEEIDGYAYIGVLEVPSLGLTLPVMADWDESRLRISPCLFSGSYYTDDMVLCGHNYARHFGRLLRSKAGSDVYFTNVEGVTYHYLISYQETLKADQVEEMSTGDDWDLTLFTCNMGGRTRRTVRCIRVTD